ncbi:IS110 family transposase [Rhodocytophaga aerolata]|uniref:IS110 family transposase n=1 Tax=Rhodocytophaga aerolata TaxID=455078 RepID=A0ABT8RKR2_9BACT|nr:IS110 family transposase [Rhodocytophaga aerolata]MDO1451765.1 IS110 family transposase [Rhodocytophaga aerolata]
MKKTVFVGIDISKATFDATLYQPATNKRVHRQFDNKPSGFRQLLTWIKQQADLNECVVCLEATGLYHYRLCYFLSYQQIAYAIESPYQIKHSMGIIRGKSDKADATLIAEYAARHTDKLRLTQLPSSKILELKLLLTHRNRLIKQKNRFSVSASELIQVKELVDVSFILGSLQQQLKIVKEQLKKVNQALKALLQVPELDRQAQLLCSVPGVGLQIAAHMIAYSEGFTKFTTWRKFACYMGSAPFPHQSGSSLAGRNRTCRIANRKLKGLMSMGAVNMLKRDTEYRKYYRRKLKEGKHHMVILNTIRNKLLSRMFAVIRRNSPYIALQR